ncbi:MAG: LPS-assembly protein LptD, partial [Candidatus Electrothrix sp. AUS1_2]|nr:LPS-assembly protein LptD [Candidatus Electrothrix sp. AUS1_2]
LAPKKVPALQDAASEEEGAEKHVEEVDEDTESEFETEDGEVVSSAVITTIKADWVVYDMDLGTVKLRGNVFIDIGPDKLQASEGVVHLTRETASFTDATIIRQYKDMRVEGRVVEKTGELTYHIEDGWLITCKLKEGETPPWSFKAADAEITDGGYALLKHATFRIKDVPILYTPYMVLPAKRNRQTGLLFPSFSLSDRDGFSLEWPLFINISPSSDITLYPHYLAERGFMAGAEGRYMLDEESRGTFMANFLNDDLSDIENPDNAEYYADGGYTHTNQNRYWVRGKADQKIGDWITRADIDLVSDQDYLAEFSNGFTGYAASDKRLSDQFGRGLQDRTTYQQQ